MARDYSMAVSRAVSCIRPRFARRKDLREEKDLHEKNGDNNPNCIGRRKGREEQGKDNGRTRGSKGESR
jgi:hypothetical protein